VVAPLVASAAGEPEPCVIGKQLADNRLEAID
jgi:hypothetical protein